MKRKNGCRIGPSAELRMLVLGLCIIAVPSMVGAQAWLDNDSEQKSNDPKYNYRRSEHFRITWAKGASAEKDPQAARDANNGFKEVTEQMVQGNLQMLEGVFHRFHDAPPNGMGFHSTGWSTKPENNKDGKMRRNNLIMSCTGNFASGAWGGVDSGGYPIFALPPGYLSFDTPSGATPHEYNHTSIINAEGFNETPYDGMWHEGTSNWFMLQYNNAYPGPGGAIQPYLSIPHGRNYYDCWPILEYMREQPGYGYDIVNKIWTQANGTKAKGGEYMYDAIVRLDTNHGPDSYNFFKDTIGGMASHSVTWDYERGQFFKKSVSRSQDPYNENYRRGYTELERRNGDTTWFRVPFAHAPMQVGYNLVPIALNGKPKGQAYQVNVNFKPLWDPIRHSDMRATLVAVNDNGEPRYSTMWNGGVNGITLADDENKLFLAVAATPDFMGYEGFSRPLPSDLPLQPMSYEVAFPNCKATAFESVMSQAKDVSGKPHSNGGGFVADSAKVEASVFVGPNAKVLGNAQALGNARIEDYACVMGNAVVKDNAIVSGHALVKDSVQVYDNGKVRDWATVGGNWKIYENGRALERCTLMGGGDLFGCATEKGNTCDYGNIKVKGTAIKEYDTANGCNLDKGTLMCWVWGADQSYGDKQPDNLGIYCGFHFEPTDAYADTAKLAADGSSAYWIDAAGKPKVYDRTNTIYAHDTFGCVHGILMGSPRTVTVGDAALGNVLPLNGKDQYIELRRDVADFKDTTYAIWVSWTGGAADQKILNFGDGANKYAYLTPKNADGKVAFVISNTGKAGEQVLVGDSALSTNKWAHVAVTLKGDTGTLYIDGKAVATNSKMTVNPDDVLAENTLAGNNADYIGRDDKGNYFIGMIDDFRAYVQPQEDSVIAKIAASVTNKTASISGAILWTPTPEVPKFLVTPTAIDDAAIVMSATRPAEKFGWMEYYFKCMSGGGHDSGWISTNRYTDCMLKPGAYTYTVKMRNNSGLESAASAPAGATVAKPAAAPAAEFVVAPAGISDTAIKMIAKKPAVPGLVEYKFSRNNGIASAWQASNSWTDTGLTAGAMNRYTVQIRYAGKDGAVSAAKSAIARDTTPPARYRLGEWQTLPYSTVENKVSLRAMPVYEPRNENSIEKEPVEYFFKCVKGDAPDSGWITENKWVTPELADGTYTYQFKIRDKAGNETGLSSAESATVSNMTGYHKYKVEQLQRLPEGALVAIQGKVESVEKDHYVVSSGGAKINVTPATAGDATDPSFNGKDVTVKGGLWIVGEDKRVTWAEVK
ncbi:MAG: DUF6055 domain-containing protein [Armatimonadetes bacterium]|nr:DUF6055 domain-containing protein [Armatimonadota bacterium]